MAEAEDGETGTNERLASIEKLLQAQHQVNTIESARQTGEAWGCLIFLVLAALIAVGVAVNAGIHAIRGNSTDATATCETLRGLPTDTNPAVLAIDARSAADSAQGTTSELEDATAAVQAAAQSMSDGGLTGTTAESTALGNRYLAAYTRALAECQRLGH